METLPIGAWRFPPEGIPVNGGRSPSAATRTSLESTVDPTLAGTQARVGYWNLRGEGVPGTLALPALYGSILDLLPFPPPASRLEGVPGAPLPPPEPPPSTPETPPSLDLLA